MIQLIAAILPEALKIIDDYIPDKDAAQKAKDQINAKLIDAAAQANLGQIETNKAEAQHRSVWVAGWRPAIGWACAAGFGYTFVGYPVLSWVGGIYGWPALPLIDNGILLEMTFGMLGMAGLRTFEKLKGVSK